MRLFLVFFLTYSIIAYTGFCQAPAQPVNPLPSDQSGSVSVSPGLCATVSDPNGQTLKVKYSGRIKNTSTSKKFTIVMLPDTQFYTEEPQGNHDGGNIAMFTAQTNWIAANRESMNIVYVGQLGDCVQNGDNPPVANKEIEWQRAQTALSVIESPIQTGLPQGIPFGICVGNHEQSPFGDVNGTTTYYNQYYGSSHFAGRSYYGGHYGSNNDNHYQLFSASGIDFLVISLEYDLSGQFTAPGGPLDWAEELVENNPTRKVIVMTHYALHEDASFGPQGQAIYNKLRGYANFSFLMGAHVSSANGGEARRKDIYNGNQVHSILTDYQARPGGGSGLLRIYEFDPALNKVSAKTYSPYTGLYETDASSEFILDFNMLPAIGEMNAVASGSTPCYTWPDLLYDTEYLWGMELYDGQNITMGPLWRFTTSVGPSLPLTLLDFNSKFENNKVKLTWKTVNELNNDRFEIERSSDGTNYRKIGAISGKGNSAIIQNYVYNDDQPLNGKTFYRLKQVDVDGRHEYSKISIVIVDNPLPFVVYPNPVSGKADINIYFPQPGTRPIKISVYDMWGRQLFESIKKNTLHHYRISPDLSTGVYFLQISGDMINATEKIIIE